MRDPIDHFWSRVNPEGCWLWTGARTADGYGNLSIRGRLVRAHRLAFELARGPIPEGMHVLHRCDVRNCVRPDHLFLGANADNVADRVAKGRTRTGSGDRHWTRLYPERLGGPGYGRSQFTADQVREIRALYAAGDVSQPELGRRFGVSHVAIGKILRRVSYPDVV